MTKEQCIEKLILNPKYASPWIDKAATIMSEFPEETDEEFCAQYNSDQLSVIYEMLKYNATDASHHIDLNKYASPEFNDTQMHLFLSVFMQASGDYEEMLEKIANPKYTYEKINFVCAGLIDGLDLSDHIEEFTAKQLASLYSGFKDGIDISKYDSKDIPGDVMNMMRFAMVVGYTDVSYDTETDTLVVKKSAED